MRYHYGCCRLQKNKGILEKPIQINLMLYGKWYSSSKTETNRTQLIDNLNCFIPIKKIEFIITIFLKNKPPGQSRFPGEIYLAFKEE